MVFTFNLSQISWFLSMKSSDLKKSSAPRAGTAIITKDVSICFGQLTLYQNSQIRPQLLSKGFSYLEISNSSLGTQIASV